MRFETNTLVLIANEPGERRREPGEAAESYWADERVHYNYKLQNRKQGEKISTWMEGNVTKDFEWANHSTKNFQWTNSGLFILSKTFYMTSVKTDKNCRKIETF